MSEKPGVSDDETSINVEVPGDEKTRYISVTLPNDQYEMLNDVKDEFGITWRGLLVHSRRKLNGIPRREEGEPEKSQYELVNETRKHHGFTWKGMLLFAARDLRKDDS